MIRWRVGLSSGENFTEGDKYFPEILGQDSPWLRLINYIEARGLNITSLGIVAGNRQYNLPSIGTNPKFRAFINAPKPIKYRFGRVIGGKVSGGQIEVFGRVEAVYEDYILQLWVDERTLTSYVLTLPL